MKTHKVLVQLELNAHSQDSAEDLAVALMQDLAQEHDNDRSLPADLAARGGRWVGWWIRDQQ